LHGSPFYIARSPFYIAQDMLAIKNAGKVWGNMVLIIMLVLNTES
jgi:hypothetical protein